MSQIVRPPSAHILMPMTPARTASYGVSNPPPLQLWLHAVLMLFAELVSRAVSTLQMVRVRCTRDWHTKAPHADLPRETSGICAHERILRDDRRSAPIPQDEASGRNQEGSPRHKRETIQALMVSSTQSVRPSNHKSGLTALSAGSVEHAFPAPCLPKLQERRQKAGIQSVRNAHASRGNPLPSFRAQAHCAEDPEPRCQAHRLSSRKPRSGYPGPIRPHLESVKWLPARASS